jgi:uncharacterized protein (DUF488 family)
MAHQMATEVLTIGHSSRDYESFLSILKSENVSAIADVRSSPQSQQFPHFDRDVLKDDLRRDGISYVFLGEELGGRPTKKQLYCDGVADYERMAAEQSFQKGIDRVVEGASRYRIALMCSEYSPLDCHRCLLVGRALLKRGVEVRHILSEGRTVSQQAIEKELIEQCGHGGEDFFARGDERLAQAYRERSRQVSYRRPKDKSSTTTGAKLDRSINNRIHKI